MEQITFEEYVELAGDLNKRDQFIAHSKVIRGKGGFDFRIVPNPETVRMTDQERQLENALQIGNETERAARKLQFIRDRILFPAKPVLISEGDSWFQFPIIVRETIDHLNGEFAILSLGAAGDTAANMVDGNLTPGQSEYLANLQALADDVKAFLFSAAGNDIIGEDPTTKKSALFDILKDYNGNPNDISGHINEAVLADRMKFLKEAYSKVISDVRAEPKLKTLPIIFHGYDYAYPYPWGPNDARNPLHAAKDEWLGEPFAKRRFPATTDEDRNLRRGIIIALIDRLYAMLNELAGDASQTRIWVVNCRHTLTDVSDWIDEIHGTSAGFAKVAARFKKTIDDALSSN